MFRYLLRPKSCQYQPYWHRRYLNIIRGNDLRERSVKTNELAKILKQVSWWLSPG